MPKVTWAEIPELKVPPSATNKNSKESESHEGYDPKTGFVKLDDSGLHGIDRSSFYFDALREQNPPMCIVTQQGKKIFLTDEHTKTRESLLNTLNTYLGPYNTQLFLTYYSQDVIGRRHANIFATAMLLEFSANVALPQAQRTIEILINQDNTISVNMSMSTEVEVKQDTTLQDTTRKAKGSSSKSSLNNGFLQVDFSISSELREDGFYTGDFTSSATVKKIITRTEQAANLNKVITKPIFLGWDNIDSSYDFAEITVEQLSGNILEVNQNCFLRDTQPIATSNAPYSLIDEKGNTVKLDADKTKNQAALNQALKDALKIDDTQLNHFLNQYNQDVRGGPLIGLINETLNDANLYFNAEESEQTFSFEKDKNGNIVAQVKFFNLHLRRNASLIPIKGSFSYTVTFPKDGSKPLISDLTCSNQLLTDMFLGRSNPDKKISTPIKLNETNPHPELQAATLVIRLKDKRFKDGVDPNKAGVKPFFKTSQRLLNLQIILGISLRIKLDSLDQILIKALDNPTQANLELVSTIVNFYSADAPNIEEFYNNIQNIVFKHRLDTTYPDASNALFDFSNVLHEAYPDIISKLNPYYWVRMLNHMFWSMVETVSNFIGSLIPSFIKNLFPSNEKIILKASERPFIEQEAKAQAMARVITAAIDEVTKPNPNYDNVYALLQSESAGDLGFVKGAGEYLEPKLVLLIQLALKIEEKADTAREALQDARRDLWRKMSEDPQAEYPDEKALIENLQEQYAKAKTDFSKLAKILHIKETLTVDEIRDFNLDTPAKQLNFRIPYGLEERRMNLTQGGTEPNIAFEKRQASSARTAAIALGYAGLRGISSEQMHTYPLKTIESRFIFRQAIENINRRQKSPLNNAEINEHIIAKADPFTSEAINFEINDIKKAREYLNIIHELKDLESKSDFETQLTTYCTRLTTSEEKNTVMTAIKSRMTFVYGTNLYNLYQVALNGISKSLDAQTTPLVLYLTKSGLLEKESKAAELSQHITDYYTNLDPVKNRDHLLDAFSVISLRRAELEQSKQLPETLAVYEAALENIAAKLYPSAQRANPAHTTKVSASGSDSTLTTSVLPVAAPPHQVVVNSSSIAAEQTPIDVIADELALKENEEDRQKAIHDYLAPIVQNISDVATKITVASALQRRIRENASKPEIKAIYMDELAKIVEISVSNDATYSIDSITNLFTAHTEKSLEALEKTKQTHLQEASQSDITRSPTDSSPLANVNEQIGTPQTTVPPTKSVSLK